jgi:hypothetical protein
MDLTSIFQSAIANDGKYQDAMQILERNTDGGRWVIGGYVYRTLAKELYGTPVPEMDLDFLAEYVSRPLRLPDGWQREGDLFKRYETIEKPFTRTHVHNTACPSEDIEISTEQIQPKGYAQARIIQTMKKQLDHRHDTKILATRYLCDAEFDEFIDREERLVNQLSIDIVKLSDVVALSSRTLAPTIQSYLDTVPLTVQSIAYDLREQRIIGEAGIDSLLNRRVGVRHMNTAKAYKNNGDVNTLIQSKAAELGFDAVIPNALLCYDAHIKETIPTADTHTHGFFQNFFESCDQCFPVMKKSTSPRINLLRPKVKRR